MTRELMVSVTRSICFALVAGPFLGSGLFCQSLSLARFEVAAIKSSPADTGRLIDGETHDEFIQNKLPIGFLPVRGNQVVIRNQSLANLVAVAYSVRKSDISGPEWMWTARFDVDAKMPDGVSGRANEMLKTLLSERFGLVLRHERQNRSGYALVLGKELKLTLSKPFDQAATAVDRPMHPTALTMQQAGASVSSYTNMTMGDLAAVLTKIVKDQVVDMTELDGKYDVTLEILPAIPNQESAVTIFDSLKRLGLRLDRRKVAVDMLVVDRIQKTPTAN